MTTGVEEKIIALLYNMNLPALRQGALSLQQRAPASRLRLPKIRTSQSERHLVINSTSTVAIRVLSTVRRNKSSSAKTDPGQKLHRTDQPEIPTASFGELGASKTVKIVVIVVLSIFGTMESIFWIKVLWAKFGPAPKDDPVNE